MVISRRIDDLRPDVAENCRTWLALCRASGLDVIITETLRDDAYQAYLYEQGRTRPGSIVTNSKYTTFHGKGLAFDFCKNVKGHEYDDIPFFREAAQIAKQMGFSWGGDWKSPVDRPHIQWDAGNRYSGSDVRGGKLPPTMQIYHIPTINDKEEANDEMNAEKLLTELTDEQAYQLVEKAMRHAESLPVSKWADAELADAIADKVTDGSRPQSFATRQEVAVMCKRLLDRINTSNNYTE